MIQPITEYIAAVEMESGQLVVHGFVSRQLAHGSRRVPHSSVLLVPHLRGSRQVVLHRRSDKKDVSPGKWDFAGGHVGFDLVMLTGASGLSRCIEATALREAREELLVTVAGVHSPIRAADVVRFTELGELACEEERNVEFSTGFAVGLPAGARVAMVDSVGDDEEEAREVRALELDRVLDWYRREPSEFADGARRILDKLRERDGHVSARFERCLQ